MNEKEKWEELKKYRNEAISIKMGGYFSNSVRTDIKHISFTLSRYKFISKLLLYRKNIEVLELGCNEALGALLLLQNNDIKSYKGVDFDAESIAWNQENMPEKCKFVCGDFFEPSNVEGMFDLIFSLDVIEHINQEREEEFGNIFSSHLKAGGVAVIGTPNITMYQYESEGSREGHVNMYSQERIHELLCRWFDNVFIFNMNDEVVNDCFAPMSCYIFAVCTGKKRG